MLTVLSRSQRLGSAAIRRGGIDFRTAVRRHVAERDALGGDRGEALRQEVHAAQGALEARGAARKELPSMLADELLETRVGAQRGEMRAGVDLGEIAESKIKGFFHGRQSFVSVTVG